MTMHVMFSEFMRQRLCTLCFPNSCAKDYLTAGGCRECHSSAANEDGYGILWYRSGTLDRRTCLIMSFHFRDGMWLTQEPPCRLMIWTWFHLFIKDDGLRILPGMYNHIVIAVHFQKSTVCMAQIMNLANWGVENHIFWISPFATFLTFFRSYCLFLCRWAFLQAPSNCHFCFCAAHLLAKASVPLWLEPVWSQLHDYHATSKQVATPFLKTQPSTQQFFAQPWHVLCHLGQIAAAKHSATRKGRHAHSCNSSEKPENK